MLPAIESEGLQIHRHFCEKGYFDVDDTKKVLKAGQKYALKGKTQINLIVLVVLKPVLKTIVFL